MAATARTPSRRPRGRARVLAAGLGLAVLATSTAACSVGHKPPPAGAGPTGTVSAAPPQLQQPGTTPTQSQRPNVVEIVTDDMRTDDLRWMPHVRRLIQDRGLSFENSFSSFPLCAPARSSLLTGDYAHNTGVLAVRPPHNFQAFDDRQTVATAMNQAGYNTLFLGKYVNGYGVEPARVTGRNSFRYVPPGWTQWWAAVQRPPHSGFSSGGTYNYFDLLLNHDGRIDHSHKNDYQTDVEGRIARRMVTTYHRSRKPFFLYFAPIAPHYGGPREADDPRSVLHPRTGTRERIETPARPRSVWGAFDKQIKRASGLPAHGRDTQRQVDRLPWPMRQLAPIDSAEKKAMLSLTRQRAESLLVLDRQIGKLVTTLKRTGEYQRTVLMFTSDNGYFLGEHRMRQGKIWGHEPSLRVPFLVAGPGIPRGRRYDPISSDDIAATVLDLGRAPTTHVVDGASVVPSFRRDRGWRVPLVVESRDRRVARHAARRHRVAGFGTRLTGSGVRTARWKYVRYVDGDGELYDLRRDPSELQNLYGRRRYAGVQRQLAQVWLQARSCSGAACRTPLPADLQVAPARLAALTQAQERLVQRRYGVPAL